jgi:hypothetical protein
MAAKRQREKQEGAGARYSPQGHASRELIPQAWSYLLKFEEPLKFMSAAKDHDT